MEERIYLHCITRKGAYYMKAIPATSSHVRAALNNAQSERWITVEPNAQGTIIGRAIKLDGVWVRVYDPDYLTA